MEEKICRNYIVYKVVFLFLVYTLQSGQKLLSQVSGFCPQLKLGWKRASLEAFDFLNRTLTKYESYRFYITYLY